MIVDFFFTFSSRSVTLQIRTLNVGKKQNRKISIGEKSKNI